MTVIWTSAHEHEPRAVLQSGQRKEAQNCKNYGATGRSAQQGLAGHMHSAEGLVRTQSRRRSEVRCD